MLPTLNQLNTDSGSSLTLLAIVNCATSGVGIIACDGPLIHPMKVPKISWRLRAMIFRQFDIIISFKDS